MIYKYLYYFIVIATIAACANEIPPTGGPEDIYPPKLLTSLPDSSNNLNYLHNEVVFEFDEWVEGNSFKKNTIITPDPGKYTYSFKKKKLIIEFEEGYQPNTTYRITLNHSVRDITKKNEIGVIDLAFSTGAYLDSLKITGKVNMLMTKGNVENALVGLYILHDSLDIRNQKPNYFTYSTKKGDFEIKHLKQGNYELFAFIDKNNNQKLDIKNEYVGYLDNDFFLKSSLDTLLIQLTKQDTVQTELLYTKAKSHYHQLTFNRGIYDINYEYPFEKNISKDGKTVFLYSSFEQDSIPFIFSYKDSTQQSFIDTAYLSKSSKPDKERIINEINILNKVKKKNDTVDIQIAFTEPIIEFIKDSLQLRIDSNLVDKEHINFEWNENHTELSIKNYQEFMYDTIIVQINDSSITSKYGSKNKQTNTQKILKDNTEFGSIHGTVNTTYKSYKIQLLDKNFKLVTETAFTSVLSYSFENIEAGEYNIRVLIDSNLNKQFDQGNISKRTQSEPIYLFPEAILIRKNWEITDISLTF